MLVGMLFDVTSGSYINSEKSSVVALILSETLVILHQKERVQHQNQRLFCLEPSYKNKISISPFYYICFQ